MSESDFVIPKGSTILITGATGAVGGGVTNEVLKAGYKVRAPVRSQQKGEYLQEAVEKRYGKGVLELVHIPDLTAPGALDDALKGCAGVIHAASDVSFRVNPDKVITPTLEMTKNILASAAKHDTIKRFVYTSSSATVPPVTEPVTITPATYRPDEIIDFAWAPPHEGPEKAVACYTASKILSERACFDFVREHKPSFDVNIIVPNFHIGEILVPKLASSTNALIWGVWCGNPHAVQFIPFFSLETCINMEDSGLLHLAALILPEIKNERLLGMGRAFDFNDILDAMREIDPSKELPPKIEPKGTQQATVDMSRSLEALRRLGKSGLTNLKESVRQCVESPGMTPEIVQAGIAASLATLFQS